MTKCFISFDPDSGIPKYKQIVLAVKNAIERKIIGKGERIPSINQVCTACSLSRDTVMTAYNELKSLGIIVSKQGKGYYVEKTDLEVEENLFLLMDTLNGSREVLFNSLVEHLDGSAGIDVFFHHFNSRLFKELIISAAGKYTSYIIIPGSFDNVGELLKRLPADRVFILDRMKDDCGGYPGVYQDFENDVYNGMVAAHNHLKEYRRLVFLQSVGREEQERVTGFRRFCQEFKFRHKVVRYLGEIKPSLYDVYLVTSDRVLADLIKLVREYEFEIGTKFGIISFNDSALKEVLEGGITTISTDYYQMGQLISSMIISHWCLLKNVNQI